MITPAPTEIVFAADGVAEIFGTLAVVIGGAEPGTPPRGIARTTWLLGIPRASALTLHDSPGCIVGFLV